MLQDKSHTRELTVLNWPCACSMPFTQMPSGVTSCICVRRALCLQMPSGVRSYKYSALCQLCKCHQAWRRTHIALFVGKCQLECGRQKSALCLCHVYKCHRAWCTNVVLCVCVIYINPMRTNVVQTQCSVSFTQIPSGVRLHRYNALCLCHLHRYHQAWGCTDIVLYVYVIYTDPIRREVVQMGEAVQI